MPRLSEKSKNRRKGRCDKFRPDMFNWKKICRLSSHNVQIARYFNISQETLYKFLDEEQYKQEQDENYISEYLVSLKDERNKTREFIANKFLKNIDSGDNSSVIFGMKVYNGMIEAKDLAHIQLKKLDQSFRQKQFLTELANKFSLNYEQLDEFANKFFKDAKLDDI